MNAKIQKHNQLLQLLQNAANDLNLTVCLLMDYSDKRKNPFYIVMSGTLSISGRMDYNQTNMFLLGFRKAIELKK